MICLFGPDGSGKSTLAKALVDVFERGHYRVRLSWMRGTHTFMSLLAKHLFKTSSFGGDRSPRRRVSIPRSLRGIWQLLEFASLLPVLIARFVLPSKLGFVVIAERSLPDFIAWVSMTTDDPAYKDSLAAKFLKALTSQAKVKVYVTARPEVLHERRPDTSLSSVSDQLATYEELANSLSAFRLDTSDRSAEECLRAALKLAGGFYEHV